MTLLSHIMTHKKQKQLFELQSEADKLLKDCKSKGIPFFQWNEWIRKYIETWLANFDEYKRQRLNRLAKKGQNQLLERVEEEKKLRESTTSSRPPSWEELKAKILAAIKKDEQPEVFEALLADVSNFMTGL